VINALDISDLRETRTHFAGIDGLRAIFVLDTSNNGFSALRERRVAEEMPPEGDRPSGSPEEPLALSGLV